MIITFTPQRRGDGGFFVWLRSQFRADFFLCPQTIMHHQNQLESALYSVRMVTCVVVCRANK